MGQSSTNNKHRTLEILKRIESLQEKLDRLTDSYINEAIPQTSFEQLVTKINFEIGHQRTELELIDNDERFVGATKRTIRLLEAFGIYEDILNLTPGDQKSSQLFSISFKVVANLIFKEGFPYKKDLFEPFNMVQKG